MNYRSLKLFAVIFLASFVLISCLKVEKQSLVIVETTDLHGAILPYDFIEMKEMDASLANTASYIKNLRDKNIPVILLDNGDNLQGQPEVYYYNFIDTLSPHLLAEAMNWLGFNAGTVGNHDIETGHSVYDRLVNEYNFPLLAANAVDMKTGKPYFTPYVIVQKNNIRVAVMGLVTPQIPEWLPGELYSGIEFRDMTETAKLWMPDILAQKPDLVVGLFHSGFGRGNESRQEGSHSDENGTAAVALNVPGFDVIFCGHDHKLANEKLVSSSGDTVLILNGGSRSENLAQATITFSSEKVKGKKQKFCKGEIIEVRSFKPDPEFIERFKDYNENVKNYVNKVIANSTATISSRESYFGPSSFTDMIHEIQLEITGADISFAAPLSFDVKINKGPVRVADMFKLYRFENMLYAMNLSGQEILRYLEYSYSEWLNTMKGKDDYLLKYRTGDNGKPVLNNGRVWLKNQPYNFDSAVGIDYIVDVSKPEGKRLSIKSLSNGKTFDPEKTYKVAVNSYRGNGGGGHFTEGAGIASSKLRSRVVSSTERDLRYYILKSFEAKKTINPSTFNNWKIVPESWVKAAREREYILLFGLSD